MNFTRSNQILIQISLPNEIFRSAFFWFCHDERTKVKALNPEYGVGDIAKELGRKWSDCDAEMKSKYEAMADKDKQRYERVSIFLCRFRFNKFFFSFSLWKLINIREREKRKKPRILALWPRQAKLLAKLVGKFSIWRKFSSFRKIEGQGVLKGLEEALGAVYEGLLRGFLITFELLFSRSSSILVEILDSF